eukprot:TRINITY_DN4266_c1_g3_i1.p1 TRINITY_DN4266_c1_g3~~TRINITY_DN4266_c1_g3_i1.p1  ORF type:complete len:197 (-),score=23.13 TRINITY_DN4266_c1_g3_i1:50-640(-)
MVRAHFCSLSSLVIASLITESCSVLLLGAAPVSAAAAGAAGAAGTAGLAAAGTAIPSTATAAALAVSGGGGGLRAISSPPMQANMYANHFFVLDLMMGMQMAGYIASTLSFLTVGADVAGNASEATWDCWKPMLHDESTAPSRGRLLADILNDPAISDHSIGRHAVFVRNRWNESWRIDPVVLPGGQLAAHASPVL